MFKVIYNQRLSPLAVINLTLEAEEHLMTTYASHFKYPVLVPIMGELPFPHNNQTAVTKELIFSIHYITRELPLTRTRFEEPIFIYEGNPNDLTELPPILLPSQRANVRKYGSREWLEQVFRDS